MPQLYCDESWGVYIKALFFFSFQLSLDTSYDTEEYFGWLSYNWPLDRNAIKLQGESAPSLAPKTGIAYIPLYTPAKPRVSHPGLQNVIFTEEYDFRLCVAIKISVAGDTNSG